MSTALTIQVAIELTALLNAAPEGTFTPAFTAERRYVPFNDLEDMVLRVSVVAKSVKNTVIARNGSECEHVIHVAIQKKLAKAEDLAELDALMLLPDRISSYLLGDNEDGTSRRLLACGASLMEWANEPIYDVPQILTELCFTSLLIFTYNSSGEFR